jgi:hypothetical protein
MLRDRGRPASASKAAVNGFPAIFGEVTGPAHNG